MSKKPELPIIKTAEVVQLNPSSEWMNPKSNSLIYYYFIVLNDMTTGTIGTTIKDDPKLAVGKTINYRQEGMKIIYEKNPELARAIGANKANSTTRTSPKPKADYVPRSSVKNQSDFLGQAWSYAKDLILAGKTLEDVKNMSEIANAIYDEIGITLNK